MFPKMDVGFNDASHTAMILGFNISAAGLNIRMIFSAKTKSIKYLDNRIVLFMLMKK